jgi:hypothetical protein
MMRLIILFLFISSSSSTTAQKVKLLSGRLSQVKGEKEFNIRFSYDSMIVGSAKNETEYLKEKKEAWELKEEGRGILFVKSWFDDREKLYAPAFIKHFENYSRVKLKPENSRYTLIIKTKRTEGGWDAGVMGMPGEIDGEMWIVESSDFSKTIAKVGFYNFKGSTFYGGDFEMTKRIQSAYVLVGKVLGDYLRKKSKK